MEMLLDRDLTFSALAPDSSTESPGAVGIRIIKGRQKLRSSFDKPEFLQTENQPHPPARVPRNPPPFPDFQPARSVACNSRRCAAGGPTTSEQPAPQPLPTSPEYPRGLQVHAPRPLPPITWLSLKASYIRIHHPQILLPEVRHGARRRPDIQRVTGGNKDNAE